MNATEVDPGTSGVSAPLNAPAATGGLPVQHRAARAAATWAASTLYTLVTLSAAFVTTPLLLRYLGQERLGAFRAATEWIGYLSVVDMGITPALAVLVLRARAKRSASETAGVVRSGLVLLSGVAIVTATLGLPLVWMMPRLVPVSAGLRHELVACAGVLVVLVLFLPFQMSRLLLDAEQRGYWVHVALASQAVVAAVLGVVLARAGCGLVAQSVALFVGTAVGTCLLLLPSWRWCSVRRSDGPSAVTARSMWRLGWPLALSGLGVRLNLMTDSLVVGYILGPTSVFSLFATQRVVSMFGSQVNSLASASWVALAELRLTGKQDAFVAGTLELTELVVGVGVTLTGTVAAFNGHFVRLWVGGGPYGGDLLSFLTAAAMVIIGVTTIYGWALDSAGETASRIPISMSGAVGNLALSLFMVRRIGLPGVVLGTIMAELLSDAWFTPLQVSRRLGVPGKQITMAVLGGLVRGLPWVGVATLAAHLYQPRGWSALCLEAAVGGSLSLGYTWLVVLTPDDRRRWRARIGNRMPARLRLWLAAD